MGAAERCTACCHALAGPVLREGDSEDDREVKLFISPIYLWAVLLNGLVLVLSFWPDGIVFISQVANLATVVCGLLFYGAMRYCSGARLRVKIGVAVVFHVAIMMMHDWATASRSEPRMWGICIVLLDVGLVCDVHDQVVSLSLTLMVLWLIVERAESMWLFGIYDSAYWGPRNNTAPICDCSEPPCSVGLFGAVANCAAQLFVLLADFYLTRRFAHGMKQQFALVAASVRVCTSVATMLARYEVAGASELVDGPQGAALPPDMRAAFCALLGNLDTYRPYLPQSCLPTAVHAGDSWSEATAEPGDDPRAASVVLEEAVPHDTSISDAARSSVGSSTQTTDARSSSPTHSFSAPSPKGGALRAEPRALQTALLCVNRRGFLSAAELQQPALLAEWIEHSVGLFVSSVGKGVVDLVSGDHCFASFGASKPCPNRRVAAARCAWNYSEGAVSRRSVAAASFSSLGSARRHHGLPVTSAVVSGPTLCGDFGTASLLRFMTVGGLYCQLQAADRLAAQWGSRILVDGSTHGDLSATFHCRLVSAVCYKKRGSVQPLSLWEALEPTEESNTEWMYAMEQGGNLWKRYNDAMQLWLRAGPTEQAVAAATAAAQADNVDVAAAGEKLLITVQAASSRGDVGPPRYNIIETGIQEVARGRESLQSDLQKYM